MCAWLMFLSQDGVKLPVNLVGKAVLDLTPQQQKKHDRLAGRIDTVWTELVQAWTAAGAPKGR
jgi:hypothetical protein